MSETVSADFRGLFAANFLSRAVGSLFKQRTNYACQMPSADPADERYLTAKQVRARYGDITSVTLYRWSHDEQKGFPKPVKLSEHNYWRLSELLAWEHAKIIG
ncbi:hypothetical protein HQ945_21795 [Phyllobacterium sp. BT25]|uniref:AlpA family transcriptional regulator n=1 Tax=Phyllobacterium pellucidum TaxID=2740464 RepID=A0A849VZR6_9HYPH|nr:hypothetical protein [Phyllobacterium pellucidum]NTS33897.1 hypothetical protein [Phyllobacterium pellucidum]